MDIELFREYCLAKEGATEGFPFDNVTLVFKVMGKMFALTDIETFASINLKCKPEIAIALREEFPAVQPGYHMNKTHWNTIIMDGSISDSLIFNWIDNSYNLIVQNLPSGMRKQLKPK